MRIEFNPPVAGAETKDDPLKIAHAAKQFEALLIGQLLKSVADSSSEGWLGAGSQTGSSAMELAQEQFANALSAQGGLGLTTMIVKGLSKPASEAKPTTHHVLR